MAKPRATSKNKVAKPTPVVAPAKKAKAGAAPGVPPDFQARLDKSFTAREEWASLTPAERKQNLAWLDEPKTPGAREARLAKAITLLIESNSRKAGIARGLPMAKPHPGW